MPGLVLDQTQSVDFVGGRNSRKILEKTPSPLRAENYSSRNPSKCSKRSCDVIRYSMTESPIVALCLQTCLLGVAQWAKNGKIV